MHKTLPTKEQVRVLKKIQSLGFPSAVIAGGAVRDPFMHTPYSDVDIFIPEIKNNELTIERVRAEFHMSKYDHCEYVWNDYGGRKTHLSSVIEFEFENDMFQIITVVMNPIKYVTQYFDVGLCMAYCDGRKVRYTDRFLEDAKNKTLTVCGDLTYDEFWDTMDHHIEELKVKYPNFTVKISEHLMHFNKGY